MQVLPICSRLLNQGCFRFAHSLDLHFDTINLTQNLIFALDFRSLEVLVSRTVDCHVVPWLGSRASCNLIREWRD